MPRRPNILVVMYDQVSVDALPCYGNPVVKTPTIDALAHGGVVFDAAYTNSPLCTPARAVMMTGQLPSATGGYDNAAYLPSTIPTFAHYARAGGYRTVLAGKMHFVGPDQLHGFEERRTTDIYPADFGWTPDWRHPDERIDWWFHNMDSVLHAGVAEVTNQLLYDDEVGHASVRALHDLARSDNDRPWLLVASFTHPHDPYVTRREYWQRYRDEQIPLPRVTAGDVVDDPHSARLRAASLMDEVPIDDQAVRRARRAYYANLSYVDDWTARLISTLRGIGAADDTVVVVLADHGDMLGERGLWYKMSFFEASARIPLVVWGPSWFTPRRVGEPVSLADLVPTVIELAGESAPTPVDPLAGRSLLPLCLGRPQQRDVFGEYLAEGAVAPIVMIRRGDLKFVHCPADPDQLYDLSADPDELVNLATNPAHTDLVARLRAEVTHRWNLDALTADVLASQTRRRLLDTALRQGRFTPWEYTPPRDGGHEYMRNHLDLNEVERLTRWPR